MSDRAKFFKNRVEEEYEDDDEVLNDLSHDRVLWFNRKNGAFLIVFFPAVYAFIIGILSVSVLSHTQLGIFVVLAHNKLVAVTLALTTAFGLGFTNAKGLSRKRFLGAFFLMCLITCACYIASGYEQAYWFRGIIDGVMKIQIDKLKDPKYRESLGWLGEALYNSPFGHKLSRFTEHIILESDMRLVDRICLSLYFYPVFAAFLFGVLPAIWLVVCAAFAMHISQEDGSSWDVRRAKKVE
jgi:hypothetical protein